VTRAVRAYVAARVTLESESRLRGLCLGPSELDAMAAAIVDRVLPALAPELVADQELAGHGARRTGGLR
jgi:hypothetical protein